MVASQRLQEAFPPQISTAGAQMTDKGLIGSQQSQHHSGRHGRVFGIGLALIANGDTQFNQGLADLLGNSRVGPRFPSFSGSLQHAR